MANNKWNDTNWQRTLTKILVQRLGELVQSWWDLQPLLEDPSLPLNTNNLWPFHKPMQIFLWRQSTSNPKLLCTFLEQWIHHLLLNKTHNQSLKQLHLNFTNIFKAIHIYICMGKVQLPLKEVLHLRLTSFNNLAVGLDNYMSRMHTKN